MEAAAGEANVTLVDAGDALQGAPIGTLSGGKYLVDIMNEVGYDIAVPGNHEFDYGMDRMLELMGMQKAAVVSCNFTDLKTGKTVFEPYKIIDYGDVEVAYVGITTPKTYTSTTPKYFQDASGNYIYGFCEDADGKALYDTVQASVDAAIAEGADYVIAVGHIGDTADTAPWQSTGIIANTDGIDVFIDGHSHSTIEGNVCENEKGEDVILTSTGTKLTAIGKLVISPDGKITTALVKDYTKKDAGVDTFIKTIKAENDKVLNKVVAKSGVALITKDPATGTRLIRNSETSLGDLAADAYRSLLGADIAVVNGGGIRADIAAGDITYNNIISVHPFSNLACLVEATGQEILDMLEMGARNTPAENGGFLQVSGLTYEIHTYIKNSVKLDDKGSFVKVEGEYRVKNVKVSGKPLDLNKTYTLASHDYMLKNGGDGFSMFRDNKLLKDGVMLDNQVLTNYIVEKLNGVVGDEYKNLTGQGRISIKATPFTDVPSNEWYSDNVTFIYTNGIMNGMTANKFSPNAPLTGAMFITMLYRQAGSPEVDGGGTAWYSNAAAWAEDKGIITGEAAFDPVKPITRQEMAVYLYRYIKSEGGGFEGLWSFSLDYSDKADIDDDALEAVSFLTMNKIFTGSKFEPDAIATRAMGAAVMRRFAALEPSNTAK
jgi:2',3'-cyclic-nucleotide 2'-phosphodiesterase (5'-nucleotidase family)